jgi:Terminase large subunit, endonuclease domain
MRSRRFRHDGNPVLIWCIGNVVGKADRRGNLYSTKSRAEQKIDAAVALMMAIGPPMTEDKMRGWMGSSHRLIAKLCAADHHLMSSTGAGKGQRRGTTDHQLSKLVEATEL